jgi:hypothetical protein
MLGSRPSFEGLRNLSRWHRLHGYEDMANKCLAHEEAWGKKALSFGGANYQPLALAPRLQGWLASRPNTQPSTNLQYDN